MSHPRRLLHAYTSRRSPWGPPWWIYGVTFGAANLIRQAAVVATTADLPQGLGLVSWLATAFVVIAVVNTVAVVRQRRSAPPGPTHALWPAWPLRRRDDHGRHVDDPLPGHGAAHDPTSPARRQPPRPSKWAPWWLSLVVVVSANHLRRAVGADGGSPAVRVLVALAFSALVFIVLTVVYRAAVRPTGRHGGGHDASA